MSQPTPLPATSTSTSLAHFYRQKLDVARTHFSLGPTDRQGKPWNNDGLPDWLPVELTQAGSYPCETELFDIVECSLAAHRQPPMGHLMLLTLLSADGEISPGLGPAPASATLRIHNLCRALQRYIRRRPGALTYLRRATWKTCVDPNETLWFETNSLPDLPESSLVPEHTEVVVGLDGLPVLPRLISLPSHRRATARRGAAGAHEDWMQFINWELCLDAH